MVLLLKNAKIFRNVTDDQWAKWKNEVAQLKALTAYGTDNWLVNYKSFKESIYWAALTQFGESYPEETLYKDLSAQSLVQALRIGQLEDALSQHGYDPTYTASEIPITIDIPTVNVPANYLNLPMRGSNTPDSKQDLLTNYADLVKEANTPTPTIPITETNNKVDKLAENAILAMTPDNPVVTGGISGGNLPFAGGGKLLLIGIIGVIVYFILKPKKQ